MEKIGLIAGNRKFPFLWAREAKLNGCYIVAAAIRGDADPGLKTIVDKFFWVGLSELDRMAQIFKSEGVTKVVMAGQVSPRRLFSKEVLNSPELVKLLQNAADRRADSIFSVIAQKLGSAGLELVDSTIFIEKYLATQGVLTDLNPDSAIRDDIKFGFEIAKAVAGLDIGQSIAVKDKSVIAVEALEGTDNLIRRAGRLSRKSGITIIKVNKPNQDKRFDIPVVGLGTIKNLVRAGAKCLAIESGTLILDREKAARLADKKGICIVAL